MNGQRSENLRKLIITGLPAINRFGDNVELEVMYLPIGEIPSSKNELRVVTYSEAGVYLFHNGIDIYSKKIYVTTLY